MLRLRGGDAALAATSAQHDIVKAVGLSLHAYAARSASLRAGAEAHGGKSHVSQRQRDPSASSGQAMGHPACRASLDLSGSETRIHKCDLQIEIRGGIYE
jgi:hypothetical protein